MQQFPPKELDWSRLVPMIGPANAGLARYDGLLRAIPNASVLLSPLTTQEAVLSSRIEGTVVSIGEVLEIEAGGAPESMPQPKRDDAEEVLNYRKAVRACVNEMERHPLSQQILRSAHSMLMEGVRGRDKSPGQYRNDQNWIGSKGCKIEEASFIPIAPEHVQSGMDAWEGYLNSNSELDKLVQLAILHVEFEALHPFKDGNGRLGRMLIPLYLANRKLLSGPDFYMSSYLEANHEEYHERLRAVSKDGDWEGWCEFFLTGISVQATENERKASSILSLYDALKSRMRTLTHSQYSIQALDFIFQFPVFNSPLFTNHAGIPKATAARILSILKNEGIILTIREGKGRRAGIFAFRELLNIAEGKEVF